ncbi:hypothetical protein ACOME3_003490 [Neoechinorhynchus agilis]
MDIKTELDRKREKLRLLREAKRRKATEFSTIPTGLSTCRDATDNVLNTTSIKTDDIDQMLRSLGIEPTSQASSSDQVAPSTTTADLKSSTSYQISAIEHVDIGVISRPITYEKESQTTEIILPSNHFADGLEWDDDDFLNTTITDDQAGSDHHRVSHNDHHRLAFNVDNDVDDDGNVVHGLKALKRFSTFV